MTVYDLLYLLFIAAVLGSLMGMIWAMVLYWAKF